MQTVAVIDYGMGNLHSVAKALEHVGAGKVLITAMPIDAKPTAWCSRVLARFAIAWRRSAAEFDAGARRSARRPFLGICVGMQACSRPVKRTRRRLHRLSRRGEVLRKDLHEDGEHLKVPHMGWNEVRQTVDHPLWHEVPDMARFYFVHSYYIAAATPGRVVGGGHYGVDFAAALAEGSRFAVQFHPEKSHTHGLQLLQNFAAWDGRW